MRLSLEVDMIKMVIKDYGEITLDLYKDKAPVTVENFEKLVQEKEEYTTAYLYVLAEYEMIDKMRDILANSATQEYIPFKALIDLKDSGKHTYSIETLCYK